MASKQLNYMDQEKLLHTESKEIKPITIKYLITSVVDLFDIDRGFVYTIYSWFKNPKSSIELYLGRERFIFSNPFRILAVLVAISTLLATKFDLFAVSGFFQGMGGGVEMNDEKSIEFQEKIYTFLLEYFNLITFSSLPLMAFSTKILFSKPRYNYAEHLVINAFILAITTLIFIVFVFVGLVSSLNLALQLYFIGAIIYQVFAYVHIFIGGWFKGIFKGLLAITLQYLLMSVFAIIGVLIYLLLNPDLISNN